MISKPQPGEYAEFTWAYLKLVMDGDILERLMNQKDISYQLFSAISAEKADYAYAEGKWTIKESLCHMIDSERVFAYRALCISRGEQQSLPGFDQDTYAAHAEAGKRSMQDLADEFKAVREANLYLIRALSEEQETRMGVANNTPTSVRALVHIMAGHELHHLNIIRERYLA